MERKSLFDVDARQAAQIYLNGFAVGCVFMLLLFGLAADVWWLFQ